MNAPLRFALAILLLLSACTPASTVPEAVPAASTNRTALVILAAASLTEPFTEIAPLFEAAHPGVRISFNFSSSHQLAQQLANGSPADIFASANQKQMDIAVEAGRIGPGRAVPFVRNRLVAIVPHQNPARIVTLQDLAQPGLKMILASKEIPVGQYSLEFLEKAAVDPAFAPNYQDQVIQNIVSYEDNVKAVLTKVVLGEADAGIVYISDITSENAARVRQIDIPDHLNVIAIYPVAVISDSRSPILAQAFVDLLLSQEGQAILARYGFIPAAGD
jgi:molybdate transport system substrate-binding protein